MPPRVKTRGYVRPRPSCWGGRGAVPCLALAFLVAGCAVPIPVVGPLAVAPAWWLSLGSSPVLAFAPDWWSLHVAAVVAAVVHSVLLGVGHYVVLLLGRPLVLVKLKEKITHEQD